MTEPAFRPGVVDYERQAPHYSRGRSLSDSAAASWRGVVDRHFAPLHPTQVLDLGSGTGRFSPLLAEWLGCRVVGVEPSSGMRRSAQAAGASPSVEYIGGTATAIPLEANTFDAAWLAYMVHHVPDRKAGARELVRVLRPGAIALVIGAYTPRRKDISLFKYFPEALVIADNFATASEIEADFAAGGLTFVAEEYVEHASVSSLTEAVERMSLRADSTLQLISDEAFERGMERLRAAAAAEKEPRPVTDKIDVLVFRNSKG
ncbi:MAG: class I SAM-dependent methyltransferase [Chloroflexota bacterium]